MIRFKQYLLEKTFRLGKDVDYIYDTFFKGFVKAINSGHWDGSIPNKIHINSQELSSNDAKKAHAINPITIHRAFGHGNAYQPIKHIITLDVNSNALDVFSNYGVNGNLEKAKNLVGNRGELWLDDISEKRIKGTIYHELSHWLDDTFHNNHLLRMVKKAHEDSSAVNQGGKTSTSSKYEINAQIHAIKEMKRHFKKSEWDAMTWDDLVAKSAALDTMSNLNKEANDYKHWRKELLKRMAREKLLGKNMKFGYN